jgi:hypothetical protein
VECNTKYEIELDYKSDELKSLVYCFTNISHYITQVWILLYILVNPELFARELNLYQTIYYIIASK